MKFLLFISLFGLSTSYAQSIQDYKNFITKYEGYKHHIYSYRKDKFTVGIGHDIKPGEQLKPYYTDREIDKLFLTDLQVSLGACLKLYPSFNKFPEQVKLLLVSLAYNVGPTGLSKFIKFNLDINSRRWKAASYELYNSLWYNQVGPFRSNDYIRILNNI